MAAHHVGRSRFDAVATLALAGDATSVSVFEISTLWFVAI
jgi:hypothetical protein